MTGLEGDLNASTSGANDRRWRERQLSAPFCMAVRQLSNPAAYAAPLVASPVGDFADGLLPIYFVFLHLIEQAGSSG